jgi:hypothetical protein
MPSLTEGSESDFEAYLQNGFDDLRALLLRAHVAEIDAINCRKDVGARRVVEIDSLAAASEPGSPSRTDSDKLRSLSDSRKLDVIPDNAVAANGTQSGKAGIQCHADSHSIVDASLATGRTAQTESDELVNLGNMRSNFSITSAEMDSECRNGDRRAKSGLMHFHMKAIWMSLVESGLQKNQLDELR